jgi:predicted nucleic acid-binding protein
MARISSERGRLKLTELMATPENCVLLDTSVVGRHFRDGNALASKLAIYEELYLPQAALAELYAGAFRSALSMISQGITDFATVNVKDFEGLGFRRVWNPLAAGR